MPKTLTIRVDDQTYRMLKKRAQAQNRSLANFIETTVKTHIKDSAFVDEPEMAEIAANEALVERLKKGSQDARKKRGTLIG